MIGSPPLGFSRQDYSRIARQHLNVPKGEHLNYRSRTIYILTNTAWPGWLKIGYSADPDARLSTFNSGAPRKDYVMIQVCETEYHAEVEPSTLLALGRKGGKGSGEWIKATTERATAAILEAKRKAEMTK